MTYPSSRVHLLSNVPLSISNEHQRKFASRDEQTEYFLSRTFQAFSEFTYQREEVSINVPVHYDRLYNCNYVMYQNSDYSSKWFYGFITHKEYINPNYTKIYFKMDVFQTWQFELNFKPSFVVREHRQRWNGDGSPVVNTLDEGLDYGTQYKVVSAEQYNPSNGVFYLVVVSKKTMHEGMDNFYYASLNGLPQLLVYYVHPFTLHGANVTSNFGTISPVADFLATVYTQSQAVNNIVSIYVTDILPDNPTVSGTALTLSDNYERVTLTAQLNGADVTTIFVKDMPYGSLTYSAGNKYEGFDDVSESKLLMYPYALTEVVDLRGHKVTYKNEYIDSPDLDITINGSLGLNNKVTATVKNYLTGQLNDDIVKIKINHEQALINNDPNDLPIMTDLLGAFLQGNRNQLLNQKQQIAWEGSFGALGNALSRDPIGVVHGAGSSFLQIQGMFAKMKDISNTPPQLAHMGSNVYYDYGHRLTGIWIVKKQITDEYQKRLSDYFKMFGYKVNELKIPDLDSRQHFNYIQTVDINITADIPQGDLDEIKSLFNRGITLWHGDYIGDYSRSNGER